MLFFHQGLPYRKMHRQLLAHSYNLSDDTLPHFMGIEGCIYCGPIADFLAAVVTIIMAFLEFKNMPKTNGE